MKNQALGMIETRGLVAAVEACDAMLKAARVSLVKRQLTWPAIVTICVSGDVAAVKAAVNAGERAAARVGLVLSTHVIPQPAAGIMDMVQSLSRDSWRLEGGGSGPATRVSAAPEAAVPALPVSTDLNRLSVRELRALARSIEHFPLSGREISLAKRSTLLELLAGFMTD